MAMPATTRPVSRWPSTATPIIAVNSGVAALSSAPTPTGSVSVAKAINVNGIAENVAPVTRKSRTRPRAVRQVRRPAIATRSSAASVTRISAAQTAPTSGAAIRMNRKTAPHTAPRNTSRARSVPAVARAGEGQR